MLGDAMGERAVPARVDAVQPGADNGDRAALAVERAFMGRAVDAQRQAGHHGVACAAQVGSEGVRVVHPLRARVAAADEGDGGPAEELEMPVCEEQQRRIGGFEQGGRIVRVADRQDMPSRAAGQPAQRGGDMLLKLGRLVGQRLGDDLPGDLAPARRGSGEYLGRPAECRQEAARRAASDAGSQHQPQPGGKFLAVDHAAKRRGVRAG